MANNNSILKLQVDDKQYEASLKSAQQGLQALQGALRNSGKSFADVDKQTEQYIRELGKMGTTAKTTRGSIGEMSSAFVEFSRIEKQLTDQERQSPPGKALAESLEHLKNRTIEAKRELADLNKQLDIQNTPEINAGGLFGGGKLDGMLQVFGGNLMTKGFELATGAAMNFVNTIKDAAAQGIEMAKSGEGIRNAFERLNEPGLLDNLREATHGTVTNLELMKAAVKFNDFKLPLNQLGTMLAFAQQKAKDTGQSVDYMVDSIVTGLGRKSLMILDNLGLSANEIKEKMKETGDMTTAVGEIIREQMASAGDYVETAAERATKADVDLKNAMEDLGRTLLPLQEQGVGMWNALEIGAIKLLNEGITPLVPALINLKETIGGIAESISNTSIFDGYVSALGAVADKATEMIPGLGKVYMLLKAIRGNGSDDMGAGVGAAISGAISANAGMLPDVVITPTKKTTTNKGGSSTTNINDKVLTGWLNASNRSALGADSMKVGDNGPSELFKMLTQDANDATSSVNDLTKAFEQLNKVEGVTGNSTAKDGKEVAKDWQGAATAISSVGSAMSQIDDPAAKVMGTIAQAIATIALTYAKSLEGTFTPWDWIAGAAAGLAQMTAVISSIHSATGYAEGGVVAGNTYSGDQIPAMLNAGEVVLNHAQTGALASQLKDGGRNLNIRLVAKGTSLVAVIDNSLKASGKGELAVWR